MDRNLMPPNLRFWRGNQRRGVLIRRRIGHHGPGARVASNVEAGGRELAEQRDAGAVGPGDEAEQAACAGGVGGIAQGKIGTEGYIREIQFVACSKSGNGAAKLFRLIELKRTRGTSSEARVAGRCSTKLQGRRAGDRRRAVSGDRAVYRN